MQPIASKVTFGLPDYFHSPQWLQTVEDHLDYFIQHKDTRTIKITLDKIYKFRHNFYLLLIENGVERRFHHVIARVNKIENPFLWDSDKEIDLILPNDNVMSNVFDDSKLYQLPSIRR